ncbi:MAG TPA: outer membrane protein transport protein [Candidatus Binatia bacterium]|nr:outer membrane protein transport protein [Candidatus Binatia bacterium]
MLRKTAGIWHLLAFLLGLMVVVSDALAGGYMIPHQAARGLGLSNAITAGVNDASAVYYNPAALAEVGGDNLLLTGTYIGLYNSVENSGRDAVNKHDDNFLGSLFANYHIPGTDFTVGFGTYSPFGLATTYDRSFTRFAAERTELRTIYFTPAISWQPSKFFSAGAGFSYVHSSGLFSRGLCLDPVTGCTAPMGLEGRLRITDTADAFGYNLGILVKPLDNLKFGFSYRSRVDLRFDNADVKLGGSFAPKTTKAEIRPIALPPVINAGLFWEINPAWGGEIVYEYARWSEFKNFTASFSPVPTFVPLAVPLTGFRLPQDWKNTSTIRFGSYYKLNHNWEIRGGFALEESPIPNRTLNPAIPDADKLTLNTGIGYKWQKFSVDVGYMAVFYKTRNVSNNELEGLPATAPLGFAGAPGKDKYSTFTNFVNVSLGYQF